MMLPKIIIGIIVIVGGVFTWYNFAPKQPALQPVNQHASQQQPEDQQTIPDLKIGANKPFYSKDGLYLVHTWPGEEHFSNEETEVLIFNESNSKVEVKSFDLSYSVEGKTYPHKSGTWEKFPSKDNHERIEYINVSAQHYKNKSLVLESEQKGKLHWHINFGPQPLDGKQIITVKLVFIKDNQTINIDEVFNRDSGEVFSKDEH